MMARLSDTDRDADPRRRLVAALLAIVALMDTYELAGLVDGVREAMGLPLTGSPGEGGVGTTGWN